MKKRDTREHSAARGYGHKWRVLRAAFLHRNPLCRMCQELGRLTPATVVDHVTPHKGDQALMWDQSNWESLCKPCHDAAKQSQDRTGRVRGCTADGNPIDQTHWWNQ